MADIKKEIEKLSLEDLTPVIEEVSHSNLIVPTLSMIKEVVKLLNEGKGYKHIKLNVIKKERITDSEDVSMKKLSFKQIAEIDKARLARYNELRPKEEVEE